jgi:hypothetical protein
MPNLIPAHSQLTEGLEFNNRLAIAARFLLFSLSLRDKVSFSSQFKFARLTAKRVSLSPFPWKCVDSSKPLIS